MTDQTLQPDDQQQKRFELEQLLPLVQTAQNRALQAPAAPDLLTPGSLSPSMPTINPALRSQNTVQGSPAPNSIEKIISPSQEKGGVGQKLFHVDRPKNPDELGLDPLSPGYFAQQRAQSDYAQEHPLGSPVSARPGFLGKVEHGLAAAGNIAGDIVAPRVMSMIPGTELNTELKRAGQQQNFGQAEENQLRTAQTKEQNALAAEGELTDVVMPDGTIQKIPIKSVPALQAALAKNQTSLTNSELNNQTRRDTNAATNATHLEGIDETQHGANARAGNKPATANQDKERYEGVIADLQLGKPVSPVDMAWAKGYEKAATLGPQVSAGAASQRQSDAQMDRSRDTQTKRLDVIGKPIRDQQTKLADTLEILNGNMAFSDSLVAPKTLTALVSGQGTGVRITQAEISQVLHGRSTLQDLDGIWQKIVNGKSVTADQRSQINTVLGLVQSKVNQRVSILEQAQDRIDAAGTMDEQRAAIRDAQKQLDALNKGGEQQGGKDLGAAPKNFVEGKTYELNGRRATVTNGRMIEAQ